MARNDTERNDTRLNPFQKTEDTLASFFGRGRGRGQEDIPFNSFAFRAGRRQSGMFQGALQSLDVAGRQRLLTSGKDISSFGSLDFSNRQSLIQAILSDTQAAKKRDTQRQGILTQARSTAKLMPGERQTMLT